MIVASPTASFGLPEAKVGLYAAAGGLPRLVRQVGLQLASEIAMTGRRLTAEEALRFNVINKISKTQGSVVEEAVALASQVAAISPDGIIVTRHGLREAWETASVERATQRTSERYDANFYKAANTKIGLDAFAKKGTPAWVPSKL
jgi:enoyl-CoA hydratase/carnithine racemase